MPVKLTDKNLLKLEPKPGTTRGVFRDELVTNLVLRVTTAGARSFSITYYDATRARGKVRTFTLGSCPPLTLADAREKARELLARIELGDDPMEEKQAAKLAALVPTSVKGLAEEFLASKEAKEWREKTRAEFERLLRVEVVPVLGKLKPDDVTRAQLRALGEKIAARGVGYTANRTLGVASLLFSWGKKRDLVRENPCTGLDKPMKEKERDRVLSEDELRAFWRAAGQEVGAIGAAFKLMLLTAQRRGEVLSMRWRDVEGSWWTIPAEFSKNGLSHRVPLSFQALSILKALRAEGEWVFRSPHRGKGAMANPQKAADRLWERAGVKDARVHDLRRTAASYMTSAGVLAFTVERVLNHARSKVERTYDRHSYDAEKRDALETWARRLSAILSAKNEAVTA